MQDIDRNLLVVPKCFVFKIPAQASAQGPKYVSRISTRATVVHRTIQFLHFVGLPTGRKSPPGQGAVGKTLMLVLIASDVMPSLSSIMHVLCQSRSPQGQNCGAVGARRPRSV